MGLVQRVIESYGIATISITTIRHLTEEVGVPRAVFLRWPMGHAYGEVHNVEQQMTVLKKTLQALVKIKKPGIIVNLPYRWRRLEDLDIDFSMDFLD